MNKKINKETTICKDKVIPHLVQISQNIYSSSIHPNSTKLLQKRIQIHWLEVELDQ